MQNVGTGRSWDALPLPNVLGDELSGPCDKKTKMRTWLLRPQTQLELSGLHPLLSVLQQQLRFATGVGLSSFAAVFETLVRNVSEEQTSRPSREVYTCGCHALRLWTRCTAPVGATIPFPTFLGGSSP